MKKHDQSGFAAIELLLALILMTLIGFTGYYVWHSQNQAEKTLSETNQSADSVTPTSTVNAEDETAAIKTVVRQYNDAKGGINVSYTVDIEHQNAEYALGGITAETGDSGGQWFAKKVSSKWQVLSQGATGHCDELAAAGLLSWDQTCSEQ